MTTPATMLDSIVGPAPEGCLASERGRDSVSAGAAPPLGRVKRARESGRSQETRNAAALAVTAQSAISLDFTSARRRVGVVMRTADCYNATRPAAYLANIHVSRRLAIGCSRRSSTARKKIASGFYDSQPTLASPYVLSGQRRPVPAESQRRRRLHNNLHAELYPAITGRVSSSTHRSDSLPGGAPAAGS